MEAREHLNPLTHCPLIHRLSVLRHPSSDSPSSNVHTSLPHHIPTSPPNPVPYYLTPRFFGALGGIAGLALGGYAWGPLLVAAQGATGLLAALVVADALRLTAGRLAASRTVADRLSNGDDNPVELAVRSSYPFAVRAEVRDEAPIAFERRDLRFEATLAPGESAAFAYTLRPTARGVYAFGDVMAFATGPLGLVQRRFRNDAAREVTVYPSILQLERIGLRAATQRLAEVGVKRVRRLGHSMAFEQIREYVPGDDPRTVNWAATARRGDLMVNQYETERAQPVYALLDTGRTMRSAFRGMTLLDHAVNAALVLLGAALARGDRAGLVTFGPRVATVVRADRRGTQLPRLLDALYRIETDFGEPDFEALFSAVRRQIPSRALLVVFTNVETVEGLARRLPTLRLLARRHVVVVVFFENVGLEAVRAEPAASAEGVYVRAAATALDAEKRRVAHELERHGLHAVLARPENVTVAALNRYLRIKAQGAL